MLEGLADNARQTTRLKALIKEVASDAPYNRAFGKAYALKLSDAPLEPLLRRLRQVMPAYEELDGLTLEGAGHDVDNRLMLRFTLVGRQVPAEASGTLFTQIKEDRRFQVRVDERDLPSRSWTAPTRRGRCACSWRTGRRRGRRWRGS